MLSDESAGPPSARYGVRAEAVDVLGSSWLSDASIAPGVVLVPLRSGDDDSFETAVRAINQSGRLVLSEVTSKAEIRRAIAAGVGGLIVAGHEAGGRCGSDSSFVLLQAALAEGPHAGLGPGRSRPARRRGVRCRGGGGRRAGRAPPCWPANRRSARPGASGSRGGTAARRRSSCRAAGPGVRVFAMPGSEAMARLRGRRGGRRGLGDAAVGDEVGWGTVNARRSARMPRWRTGWPAST